MSAPWRPYSRGARTHLSYRPPGEASAGLRWLAVVPIVVAVPLLFFGLIWQAVVQLVVGVGLLALAAGIWMLFAED